MTNYLSASAIDRLTIDALILFRYEKDEVPPTRAD
jgi:hypothetical protein